MQTFKELRHTLKNHAPITSGEHGVNYIDRSPKEDNHVLNTDFDIDDSDTNFDWEDIIDLYDEDELFIPDGIEHKIENDFPNDDEKPLDVQFDELMPPEALKTLHDELEDTRVDTPPEFEKKTPINEDLSAQQRLVKKINFSKSKAKRMMAQKILLKRTSNPERLRKRAVSMAKRILLKKLLMGRQKSQLSPGEKSRIENILKKSAPIISRLTITAIPKVRSIERARIANR